jgi:hypothetical protein
MVGGFEWLPLESDNEFQFSWSLSCSGITTHTTGLTNRELNQPVTRAILTKDQDQGIFWTNAAGPFPSLNLILSALWFLANSVSSTMSELMEQTPLPSASDTPVPSKNKNDHGMGNNGHCEGEPLQTESFTPAPSKKMDKGPKGYQPPPFEPETPASSKKIGKGPKGRQPPPTESVTPAPRTWLDILFDITSATNMVLGSIVSVATVAGGIYRCLVHLAERRNANNPNNNNNSNAPAVGP